MKWSQPAALVLLYGLLQIIKASGGRWPETFWQMTTINPIKTFHDPVGAHEGVTSYASPAIISLFNNFIIFTNFNSYTLGLGCSKVGWRYPPNKLLEPGDISRLSVQEHFFSIDLFGVLSPAKMEAHLCVHPLYDNDQNKK